MLCIEVRKLGFLEIHLYCYVFARRVVHRVFLGGDFRYVLERCGVLVLAVIHFHIVPAEVYFCLYGRKL